MHRIEPHYNWRDHYIAAEDRHSPFYKREYSEFEFSQTIYNHLIHPQWDYFGSPTLYLKILYTNYKQGISILELMGEWNDCIHNDAMHLKREVVDYLMRKGVYRFILIGENVLNYHAMDDCYYEEWYDDVEHGWIALLNFRPHVLQEMTGARLNNYLHFGDALNHINWRTYEPLHLFYRVDYLLQDKQLDKRTGPTPLPFKR